MLPWERCIKSCKAAERFTQEAASAQQGGEKEQLIGSESRPELTNSSFCKRRLAMRYAGK